MAKIIFKLIPSLALMTFMSLMFGAMYMAPMISQPKTETMLQSQCEQYCASRCAYCPFCSDCLKQVCVQECDCNNQCKGTGFFDTVNNCRCANMNFVETKVTPTITVTAVPLQIESPPAMNVPTEEQMMMARLVMDPSDTMGSYYSRY